MISAAHISTVVLLADSTGGESKKAGPIGLLVILLLCFACYFLFRSMSRHLKRVREEFPVGERPSGSDDEGRSGQRVDATGPGPRAGHVETRGADPRHPDGRRADVAGSPPPESSGQP